MALNPENPPSWHNFYRCGETCHTAYRQMLAAAAGHKSHQNVSLHHCALPGITKHGVRWEGGRGQDIVPLQPLHGSIWYSRRGGGGGGKWPSGLSEYTSWDSRCASGRGEGMPQGMHYIDTNKSYYEKFWHFWQGRVGWRVNHKGGVGLPVGTSTLTPLVVSFKLWVFRSWQCCGFAAHHSSDFSLVLC